MIKISISFLLLILIIGCAKTKEQVAEKCLSQANATFPTEGALNLKMEFFNSCMAENQYYYTEGKDGCGEYSEAYVEKLSSRCYEYKRGD
jgi:hypothetical protein